MGVGAVRLVGFCVECKKIRLVRVTGQALALLAARAGVAHGACADCERLADEQSARRDRVAR